MQGALAERAGQRVSKFVEDSLLDVAMSDVVDTTADAVLHKGGRLHRTWKIEVRSNR